MCEPRLNSQRMLGRERDAGWDCSWGMSNRVRVAMPPEARRAVEMLRSWMVGVMADMVRIEEGRVEMRLRVWTGSINGFGGSIAGASDDVVMKY